MNWRILAAVEEARTDAERPWGRVWAPPAKRTPTSRASVVAAPGDTRVLWRRILAHVLDLAIGLPLTIWISIYWLGSVAPRSWFASPSSTFIWMIAALAVNWMLLQGFTGFSIGKAVAGIRVVDQQGEAPGLRRALMRSLPLVIEQWGVVGLWAAIRSPAHQRFGDRWARTFVVRARPPLPLLLAAASATTLALVAWIEMLS